MAPIQFFMPTVTRLRLWCLTIGTLMTRSASTIGRKTSQLPRIEPPRFAHLGADAVLVGARATDLGHRICDAGAGERPTRVVAGIVDDDDLGGAGRKAQPHQLGDHRRVGIGRLLGSAVPCAVRLDGDLLAAFDEGLDSTHGGKGTAQVVGWPTTAGHGEAAVVFIHPPVGERQGAVRLWRPVPSFPVVQGEAARPDRHAGQSRRPQAPSSRRRLTAV